MSRSLSQIMRNIRETSNKGEEWLAPFITAQKSLENHLSAQDLLTQLDALENVSKITSESNAIKILITEFIAVLKERIKRNITEYGWSNIRKTEESATQHDGGKPNIFQELQNKYYQIAGAKQR
jgi:hypothetical protein